jgi:hypothetical protein
VSPKKYAGLLAKALPKLIESDEELEHFSEILEDLDRLGRQFTAGEKTLAGLLARLIQARASKAHVRRLAKFSKVSAGLFL